MQRLNIRRGIIVYEAIEYENEQVRKIEKIIFHSQKILKNKKIVRKVVGFKGPKQE